MIIKTKSVQSVRSQKTMNEEPSPEQILRLNSAPSLLTRRHLTETSFEQKMGLAGNAALRMWSYDFWSNVPLSAD